VRRRSLVLAVGSLVVALAAVFFLFAREKKDAGQAPPESSIGASSSAHATAQPLAPSSSVVASGPVATAIDGASTPSPSTSASEDPFAQREAIAASLARKDVSALPDIERVDITKNGYVAAAAIDAVGKLGAIAPEPARTEAVRTLHRWLKQESKRTTNDAAGNVSILVDSLADTHSSEAIAPLVEALDSTTQPLHIETRIVEALVALDAKTAAPSVERFAARVRARTPADDFERELAKEALAAADAALAKWRAP